MKDEQELHNEALTNLTDQQLGKIVEKADQMLKSESKSQETNIYDRLLERLATETGLSVEEVERQIP